MQAKEMEMAGQQAARANNGQYLTFRLQEEVFAIGILNIREIIEYGQMTQVPMMPRSVRGVINLRGAVVPVIDLSHRFWERSCDINPRSCIVILDLELVETTLVVGIIVDAVNEVLEIPDSEVEPPPAFGAGVRSDCIAGMGKVSEDFVIILNLDRVVAMETEEMLAMLTHGQQGADEAI